MEGGLRQKLPVEPTRRKRERHSGGRRSLGLLFGFVGEREFGLFVEDEGTKETVGGAGAGDVDGDREDAGHALLEVVNV